MIKNLFVALFVLFALNSDASSIGLKTGYQIYVPFNPEEYDGFLLNLCYNYKKFNIESGVVFAREQPGKPFKSSLGFNLRLQYEILRIKKSKLFVNYSFEKLTQKIVIRDGKLLDKYIVHNCLGLGIEIPIIIEKILVVSNVEIGNANYHFPNPYPGTGKYGFLLFDVGIKYCINFK